MVRQSQFRKMPLIAGNAYLLFNVCLLVLLMICLH